MTLDEIRVGIDKVDQTIKQAFLERMTYVDQVADVKAAGNDDIQKPEREVAMIEKLTGDVDPAIRGDYKCLIERIMKLSRKYQYVKITKLRGFDYTKYMAANVKPAPDHNRLRIRFDCKNKCGAFASILNMIADYAVNVSEIYTLKMEAMDSNSPKYYFNFVLVLDTNLLKDETKALVYQLSQETQSFEILSSYKSEETI